MLITLSAERFFTGQNFRQRVRFSALLYPENLSIRYISCQHRVNYYFLCLWIAQELSFSFWYLNISDHFRSLMTSISNNNKSTPYIKAIIRNTIQFPGTPRLCQQDCDLTSPMSRTIKKCLQEFFLNNVADENYHPTITTNPANIRLRNPTLHKTQNGNSLAFKLVVMFDLLIYFKYSSSIIYN